MVTLKLTNGREIECDQVARGNMYEFLYIHTSLTMNEALQAFTPENAETMTAIEEGKPDREYVGFSEIYSIQKSPFFKGDIMIWMQRPEE